MIDPRARRGSDAASEIVAFSDRLVAAWYAPRLTPLTAALLPLSLLFRAAVAVRRWAYRHGSVAAAPRLPVPVVVVGSIVIGGAGKTPLVRALWRGVGASSGRHPGIVSRGYGGSNRSAARGCAGRRSRRSSATSPCCIAADARRCGSAATASPRRGRFSPRIRIAT